MRHSIARGPPAALTALAAFATLATLAALAALVWFQGNNIHLVQPWPASSPNINPVDNL